MSALHGWMDWLLFALAVVLLVYAGVLLLNLLAAVIRGVRITIWVLILKIIWIVFTALGGYLILSEKLGML